MLIDCDQCAMQHTATCDDCIVTALLSGDAMVARVTLEVGDDERLALRNLAEAGLVAPLRLVSRRHHGTPDNDEPPRRPGERSREGGSASRDPEVDEVAEG